MMTTDQGGSEDDRSDQGLSRRSLLAAAGGGFVLSSSGLFLPTGQETGATGVLDGKRGGRRGKVDRNRKRRTHGDRKRDNDKKPPKGGFLKDISVAATNPAPETFSFVLVNGRNQSPFTLQSGETLGAQDTKDDEIWIFFSYWADAIETVGNAIYINNPNFGTVFYRFYRRVGLDSNGIFLRPPFHEAGPKITIEEQHGATIPALLPPFFQNPGNLILYRLNDSASHKRFELRHRGSLGHA